MTDTISPPAEGKPVEAATEPGPPPAESRFWVGAVGLFVVTWLVASLIVVFGLAVAGRWMPSIVVSGSMSPGLDVGDVLLSRTNPDPSSLGIGSVVTFADPIRPQSTITHRVVAIDPDSGYFQTKGDANPAPDTAWLNPNDVLAEGKAMVPYVGKPAAWLWNGRWMLFGSFFLVLVAAIWSSRWAWLSRYDPWRPSNAPAVAPGRPVSVGGAP